MAIEGFCPPSPSPHSPYYQLLERGSARLGRFKNSELSHSENTYLDKVFSGY